MTYTTDSWFGCYKRGWGQEIVPEAYKHPAKVSFLLAERIYRHCIAEGWLAAGDFVVDPFSGIGGFAYHAMQHGLNFIGCELEPRFVALGNENIALWNKRYAGRFRVWGTATILQGDSRHLAEVVRRGDACLASPPFGEGETRNRSKYQEGSVGDMMSRAYTQDRQGTMDGNLATLPATPDGLAAAISSPPYEGSDPTAHSSGIDLRKNYETYRKSGGGSSWEKFVLSRARHTEGYGKTDGQLGSMPSGDLAAAISSPPYASSDQDYKAGWRHFHSNGRVPKQGNDAQREAQYGETPGQLADLPASDSGFAAAVASPPFQDNLGNKPSAGLLAGSGGRMGISQKNDDVYGTAPGQLGAMPAGDNFWAAARLIVEQTFAVLRPGGHAVFVTKRLVRDGSIVDFSQQWATLCLAVGFHLVHWHRAMLTEDNGTQLAHDGKHKSKLTKRSSFFRRLYENRHPENAIDWEDVLCFEKPPQ